MYSYHFCSSFYNLLILYFIQNGTEAQCLAYQLQLYYGQDNAKRLKLLERFTHTPQEFKHMDLIAELECVSL